MNFDRLIVTDALIMGGITKHNSTGEIAIQAIQAGADILLMPENPETAIDAIEQAIRSGIISEARIDQSLARIAQAKDKLFASESPIKLWDFDLISTLESQKIVEEILEQSLVKEGSLPLKNSSGGTNLIVVDSLLTCDFLERQTPAIAIPESFNYQTQIIEAQNLDFIPIEKDPLLLQIFIRGNPFRGSAGLTQRIQESYQKLITQHNLRALAIYGSPYILDWFREQLPADVPWLFSYGQMPSAQTVICQHLFDFSQQQKTLKGDFL